MRWLVLIIAMLFAAPSHAGYCPDTYGRPCWTETAVIQDQSDTPRTLLAAIIAFIAGLLVGTLIRPGPTLPSILSEIDRAMDGRVGEAGSHSRKKFPPALEAARRAVKAAVTKLYNG
jgi:hypothetical protein